MLLIVAVAPAASAHNSLVSSEPANGAAPTTRPSRVVLIFAKDVDLPTLTVRIATTVRSTELQLRADENPKAAVMDIPDWVAGPVTLQWKLVGVDGHTVRGTLRFTVGAPGPSVLGASADVIASTPVITARDDAGADGASTLDANSSSTRGSASTSLVRSIGTWLLRVVSYLTLFALVGILITSAFVWSPALSDPVLRRVIGIAFPALLVTTVVQLAVLVFNIGGDAAFDSAMGTYLGQSLVARLVLVLFLGACLYPNSHIEGDDRATLGAILVVLILGAWAWGGHARSLRWYQLGLTMDAIHQAAAIAWISGLAIVGLRTLTQARPREAQHAMIRFSVLASVSVTALAASGVIQMVRIEGSLAALINGTHGRLTLAKLVAVAAMLALGNLNRNRVKRLRHTPTASTRRALRRAITNEAALGIAVIAITAALVVAAPGSS